MTKKILIVFFLLFPISAFANTTYTFSWSDVRAPFFDSLVAGWPFEDLNIWFDDTEYTQTQFLHGLCELYQSVYSFSWTLIPWEHSSSNDSNPVDSYILSSIWFYSTGSTYELQSVFCVTDYSEPLPPTATWSVVVNISWGLWEDIFTKEEIFTIFQLQFVFMLLFAIIISLKKLSPENNYRRFKISNIFR